MKCIIFLVLIQSVIMNKVIKTLKTYPQVFIMIFFSVIYFLQLKSTYSDYNENHYIYIAWRLLKGEIPYRDFLVPHPPLLYIIGSLLLLIFNSIYTIRIFLYLIFIISAYLFYLLNLRLFKNKFSATIALAFYFILPVTLVIWKTFIQESLLRLIIILIFFFLLPIKQLNSKKITIISVLSFIAIYIKYSTIPFIGIIIIFLWLFNKKYLLKYLLILVVLCFFSLLILQLVTHGNYFFDTVIIRKYVQLKSGIKIAHTIIGMLDSYALLALIALLTVVKDRLYKKADLFLIAVSPLLYIPFLYILLVDGTYSYVFYPFEPLLLLIPVYLFNKLLTNRQNKLDIIGFIFTLCTLGVLLSYLQSFIFLLPTISQDTNKKYNDRISFLINKYAGDVNEILSTPFINHYIIKKKILFNFSETFLWSYEYNYGEKKSGIIVNRLIKEVKQKNLPLIILDENLIKIIPLKKSITDSYIEIDSLPTSSFTFFVPMKCGLKNDDFFSNNNNFGKGFSEINKNQRTVNAKSVFYFCNQNYEKLIIKYQTNPDIYYSLNTNLTCNDKRLFGKTENHGFDRYFSIDLMELKNKNVIKCYLTFNDPYKNYYQNNKYTAVIKNISLIR